MLTFKSQYNSKIQNKQLIELTNRGGPKLPASIPQSTSRDYVRKTKAI